MERISFASRLLAAAAGLLCRITVHGVSITAERCLRVPDDLSVTGFDDIDLGSGHQPGSHYRPAACYLDGISYLVENPFV